MTTINLTSQLNAQRKTLTIKNTWNEDMFTIVDTFPDECIVWPIGRRNFPYEKFIPIAYPLANNSIDRTRLMAIECKDEETALAILKEAIWRGVDKTKFNLLNK